MTDQQLYFAVGIPTLAVFLNLLTMLILNNQLGKHIDRVESRINLLDADVRDWAKITMQHNTDIARLKDKTGLS